ncbi:MAG: hypothetical protein NTW28_22490 [Candidatus Solibacter sp.]|nr:hypothetical protein [Candidatus Solibacter sp.]
MQKKLILTVSFRADGMTKAAGSDLQRQQVVKPPRLRVIKEAGDCELVTKLR